MLKKKVSFTFLATMLEPNRENLAIYHKKKFCQNLATEKQKNAYLK